jgi:hypothetical protein
LEREFHRDGANTLGEIILIMKELRGLEWDGVKGDYSNHRIRWTGNIIHAYLDLYRGALTRGTNEGMRGDFCTHCNRERGRSLDALEYLKMALEEYEISRELEGTDYWMHSAWLKLGVFLHKEGEDVPGPIVRLIKERELPKDFGTTGNPEARVIGWGAVLSDLIGEEEYRDVLFGMYRRKAKSVLMYGGDDLYRDAMGVTFGCHLMNMEHLGFGETASRDGLAEKYLEKVVEASAE